MPGQTLDDQLFMERHEAYLTIEASEGSEESRTLDRSITLLSRALTGSVVYIHSSRQRFPICYFFPLGFLAMSGSMSSLHAL